MAQQKKEEETKKTNNHTEKPEKETTKKQSTPQQAPAQEEPIATEKEVEEIVRKVRQDCIPNSEYIKLKCQFSDFVNEHREFEHEFENYKKRTREEIKQAKQDGIAKAVEALLPALDSFRKARKIITDEKSLEGVNLIEKSILNELGKLGVKRIECVGEPFNTEFHNAVMLIEDKSVEPGTIVEELEAGYMLDEKVIKFSKVIVAK